MWALRAGCLIPFVNLVWAPVYVLELAGAEERLKRLRRPIVVWWLVWVASTVVSIFSIATSFTTDAQGIADNTVTTTWRTCWRLRPCCWRSRSSSGSSASRSSGRPNAG